jgi:hypothetical protein
MKIGEDISEEEIEVFCDVDEFFRRNLYRKSSPVRPVRPERGTGIEVGQIAVLNSGPREGFRVWVTEIEKEQVTSVLLPREIRGCSRMFESVEPGYEIPKLPLEILPFSCVHPLGSMIRTIDDHVGPVIEHRDDSNEVVIFRFSNAIQIVGRNEIVESVDNDRNCFDASGRRLCVGDFVDFEIQERAHKGRIRCTWNRKVFLEYEDENQALPIAMASKRVFLFFDDCSQGIQQRQIHFRCAPPPLRRSPYAQSVSWQRSPDGSGHGQSKTGSWNFDHQGSIESIGYQPSGSQWPG